MKVYRVRLGDRIEWLFVRKDKAEDFRKERILMLFPDGAPIAQHVYPPVEEVEVYE